MFLASLVYTTVYPFAKITVAGVGNLVCSGMIKKSQIGRKWLEQAAKKQELQLYVADKSSPFSLESKNQQKIQETCINIL